MFLKHKRMNNACDGNIKRKHIFEELKVSINKYKEKDDVLIIL